MTLPADRRAQAGAAACQVLGKSVAGKLPGRLGVQAVSNDPTELIINNSWRGQPCGAIGAEDCRRWAWRAMLLPEVAVKAVTAAAAYLRTRRRRCRPCGEVLQRRSALTVRR